MNWKITPKVFIISILHVSDNQALPIKDLIAMGGLFGFSGNSMRVTATRLVREGRLESDERGLYRLKDMDTPISRFVNSWKMGEGRVREWDGSWLCCIVPKAGAGRRARNAKALLLPGFREGLPGLWVRPANLTMGISDMRELLAHQGMDPAAELFAGSRFREGLVEQWTKFLWPVKELRRTLEGAQERIDKSMARILSLPRENAMVESYLVGTETVHWLVTDPLLPEQMMPSRHRISLTRSMLEYNGLGKGVWEREVEGLHFEESPSHRELEGA